MSLENGTYQIKSTMTRHTQAIGRDSIEHRSLFPKDIVVQSGPGCEYAQNTHWEVERWYSGYYLKIGGAKTGLLDRGESKQVVAVIQERIGGSCHEWILRPVAGTDLGEGGNNYNICDSNEGSNLVWTIEVDENAQKSDRHVLMLEPFEPSNPKQVFTFVKVVNKGT